MPMVGRSQLAAPISSDGVVLSQPMSSTTPSMRIAADGFFDVHAREIAEQHRGRLELRLAQRHHREFERESAGFVHAALHELRELAEMTIAGRELAPGVADADDGPAVEHVVRIALVLEPAPVNEAILVLLAEPVLAAQAFLRHQSSPRLNGPHLRTADLGISILPAHFIVTEGHGMPVDRRDSTAALTGGASYPSLRGRSVFITGGGSGIGACLTESFARQGCTGRVRRLRRSCPRRRWSRRSRTAGLPRPWYPQDRRHRRRRRCRPPSAMPRRPSATSTYSSIMWPMTIATHSWTSRRSTTTRASR